MLVLGAVGTSLSGPCSLNPVVQLGGPAWLHPSPLIGGLSLSLFGTETFADGSHATRRIWIEPNVEDMHAPIYGAPGNWCYRPEVHAQTPLIKEATSYTSCFALVKVFLSGM